MDPSSTEGRPDTGIETIIDTFLAEIPTAFGKLVWVASLQVEGTAEYTLPVLRHSIPPATVSSALRALHQHVFVVWLTLGLEEKVKDFVEYSEAIRSRLFRSSLSLQNAECLVPPDAVKAERALFETDLAVVLELAE